MDQKSRKFLASIILIGYSTIGHISNSTAQDLDSVSELGLSISGALTRIDVYSDVAAAGGTSVASGYSSSFNPAAGAWDDEWQANLYLAPRWFNTGFDSNLELDVKLLDAVSTKTDYGVLYPSYIRAEITADSSLTDKAVELLSESLALTWSKKTTSDISLGATVTLSKTESNLSVNGLKVFQSESPDTDLDYLFGILFQTSPGNLLGMTIQSGSIKTRDITLNPVTFEPLIGASKITTKSLRFGYSHDFGNHRMLFIDTSLFDLKSGANSQTLARLHVGVQVPLNKKWVVRTGGNFDDNSDTVVSAGIGFYPNAKSGIEVSFQHNPFPELKSVFGDGNTWGISGYWLFK